MPAVKSPWDDYIYSGLYWQIAEEIREKRANGDPLIPEDAPIGYLVGDDQKEVKMVLRAGNSCTIWDTAKTQCQDVMQQNDVCAKAVSEQSFNEETRRLWRVTTITLKNLGMPNINANGKLEYTMGQALKTTDANNKITSIEIRLNSAINWQNLESQNVMTNNGFQQINLLQYFKTVLNDNNLTEEDVRRIATWHEFRHIFNKDHDCQGCPTINEFNKAIWDACKPIR